MHDLALVVGHPSPFRCVALRVPVIPLTHPEKIGGEPETFAGIRPGRLERPKIFAARPACQRDLVMVTDVAADIVLLDDFAHVVEDLSSGCDWRTGPWLEAIAEGVKVAIRPNAGIAMGEPCTTKAFLRLEDDKARPGALLREVIRTTDPGDSRPDDHDIEVLGVL
jgi:hypothetical protein